MAIVGSAFVSIRGDTSKLAGDIANANLSAVGARIGRQLETSFDQAVQRIAPELSAAFANIPTDLDVQVTADTSEAAEQLELFRETAEAPLELGTPDLDTDPLLRDLRDIQAEAERTATRIAAIERAGDTAVKLGTKLSLGVTAPLLLLGRQAVTSATDVERTLSQVIGLAGGTADDVAAASDRLRTLAVEVGKPVSDLGDALLAIFSAGFTGSQALDVLEASGKAAASGLGDTRDVANAVTNALASYGAGVITADEATDVLVNTVKEGKAEAADLAPQFGRLLPVAAELGVSFADVGAGLAFLTRGSGDAAQSGTQLAGVLNKLLKPSKEGAEALLAAGFGAEELRASLAERGLLRTLVDVRQAVERTGGSITQVFEDAEGLTGVLQLTAESGANAAGVFDNLADSTGTLDSAFAAFSDTNAAKLDRASASFDVAIGRVGEVVVPVLADVLELFAAGADLFSSLPGPLQQTAVGFLAIGAAAGPLLVVGGKLLQNFQKLFALAPGLTSRLGGIGQGIGITSGRLSQAAGAAGVLAAAAAVGGTLIQQRLQSDEAAVQSLIDTVSGGLEQAVSSGNFEAFEGQLLAINDAIVEVAESGDSFFRRNFDPFGQVADTKAIAALDAVRAQFGRTRRSALDLQVQYGLTADEALRLAAGGDAAVEAFARQRTEVAATIDPAQAAANAMAELETAYLRGADNAQLFADAQALTGFTTEELAEQLELAADRANELGDAFVEGLSGIAGAFEATFGDDKKDTLKNFFGDLRESATRDLAFTANLQSLVARGATDLATQFANQGLAAADLAAEAAGLSDAALADAETKFDFLALQEGRAEQRQRAFATRITDGTLALVESANTAAEGLFGPDLAETIQPRLAAALEQGDEAFLAELDEIAAEARERSVAIGTGVGEGASEGLEASVAAVKAAAQAVVDATLGVFTDGFRIGSPSKVMMDLGGDVAEGFAIGVTSGLGDVDLTDFMRQLPTAQQLSARSQLAATPFGASPAQAPQLAAAPTTITFGDIVVPVPPGATPAEQAAAVGRYVNWSLAGAVG